MSRRRCCAQGRRQSVESAFTDYKVENLIANRDADGGHAAAARSNTPNGRF
jgi:hypothetical protein